MVKVNKLKPSFANCDTSSSVPFPIFVIRIHASRFHRTPYAIYRIINFSATMLIVCSDTSAGFSFMCSMGNQENRDSAIASKSPDHAAICSYFTALYAFLTYERAKSNTSIICTIFKPKSPHL